MIQFDEKNKFKLELQLEAQMPMIHFQSRQSGATIRASEVKPKLDRYILEKLMNQSGKTVKELKQDAEYEMLFLDASSDSNQGLDYKMQITVADKVQEIDLDNREVKYSIYYANMGKQQKDKVYAVFSNPVITVICFKESVRKLLVKYIEEFFLVTNFGTMQNKGFGSFAPKGWSPEGELSVEKEKEIAAMYQALIPGCRCYAIRFPKVQNGTYQAKNEACQQKSEVIKSFYSNMKSGQNFGGYSRSYIYTYMHKTYEMGNEKAWMKKEGISPKLAKPGSGNEEKWARQEAMEDRYYYVRAFLGIGKNISYAKSYLPETTKINAKDKATVTVTSEKIKEKDKEVPKFERIPSPIYFKVLHNVVFIVAFEIPEELYGTVFQFESDFEGSKRGEIAVPKKEELIVKKKTVSSKGEKVPEDNKFDIQDFMDSYVNYYNQELPKKVRGIYKKAVRIDA